MTTIKLLTTAQASEILGLKLNTMEIWRVQGIGPIYRKIGRLVRYAESDLIAYINAGTRRSTSEQAPRMSLA